MYFSNKIRKDPSQYFKITLEVQSNNSRCQKKKKSSILGCAVITVQFFFFSSTHYLDTLCLRDNLELHPQYLSYAATVSTASEKSLACPQRSNQDAGSG